MAHPPHCRSSELNSRGHVILKRLLPEHSRHALLRHALARSSRLLVNRGDQQVPGTPAFYGDAIMNQLLEQLRPLFEGVAGLTLFPTYSYFRVYKHGDELRKHRDRPACEISASVSLGFDSPEPWPLWMDNGNGPVPVCLNEGDGALYKGVEVSHWRDTFTGTFAAQVFLHYVDAHGPYAEWRYDKRPQLSVPKSYMESI